MTSLQRVLFLPFSLLSVFTRQKETRPKERKQSSISSQPFVRPQESRRFRLERECSNYRSIHFPR